MKVSLGHTTNFKLVFAGTFGVGKTTAIQSISDIPVSNTDVASLELTEQLKLEGKTTTTVGFDYGELHLSDNKKIALYGLPGQQRFDEVWMNLLTRDSGVILWLYGMQADSLNECKIWLDNLKKLDTTRYLTVVVTRLPIPTPSFLLEPFRELVSRYNPYAPVITADPREKSQVIQAVLMAIANPELEQK